MTLKINSLAIIFLLISASYTLTNVELYLPMIIVFLILFTSQKYVISTGRLFLALYIIITACIGFTLSKLNGANLDFAVKFVTPLVVLASFICIKNYRELFIRHHKIIIIISSSFSIAAALIIRLEIDNLNALILRGWSVTLAQNRGISAWHYFALSISTFYIFVRIHTRTLINWKMVTLCLIQIVCLLLANGTGAFILAIFLLIFAILPYNRKIGILPIFIFYTLLVLVIDYFTSQFLCDAIVSFMRAVLSNDRGDLIRLIQIEYFLQNVKVLGNGFGTLLHFDFSEVPDRTAQHARFPYASEVVFLNYINGGGIFIAAILLFFARNMLYCLHYFIIQKNRLDAFLGLSCSLILVGSISNPFLLSPISMTLLAISYDCYRKVRYN